jgi:hypothetical protein
MKDQFAGGNMQSPRSEESSYNEEPVLEEVIKSANTAGVTLYPISGGGMRAGMEMPDASQDTPLRAQGVGLAQASQPDQALQMIAAQTGGTAFTGSSNYTLGFDRISGDLNTYYSLGYKPDEASHDVSRNIRVRVRKPGLVVRTRQSFVQKTGGSSLADIVRANLLYPATKNDLGITITASETKLDGEKKLLPVDVHIPTSALTLVPEGTDLAGRFSVHVAFFRGDGQISPVTRQEQSFKFPADSLKRRKELTMRLALTVDTKTDAVSIAVMDEVSHATGFATMTVK